MKDEDIMNKLHQDLRKALQNLGYKELLPVQKKAIPIILSERHTLITAPTGGGKTEAALIPILSKMLKLRDESKLGGGVKLVYVTPLRALNRDLVERIRRLAEAVNLSVQVMHSDINKQDRERFVKSPPDILVTTPETLNILVTNSTYGSKLLNVRWLVIDELHNLVRSKRGSELSVTIERLQMISQKGIQKIGLSATLSKKSLEHAVYFIAGSKRIMYALIPVTVVEDSTPKQYNIAVVVVKAKTPEYEALTAAISEVANVIKNQLTKNSNSAMLVFVNTRHAAELLKQALSSPLPNVNMAVHHGSLSRTEREEAEKGFKNRKYKALIATSTLELGIDIGSVDLVIQFLSPGSAISMKQRAGRAGHRLQSVSEAVIITVNNLFEILESGIIAFRAENGHIEDLNIHDKPYDVLAHQIVGLLLQRDPSPMSLEEIHSIVAGAYPFKNLELDDIREVLKLLKSMGIVEVYNQGNPPVEYVKLKDKAKAEDYFYNVTMIPDVRECKVVNEKGVEVGTISEKFLEFLAMRIKNKDDSVRFALAGKVWEITLIYLDLSNGELKVRQVSDLDIEDVYIPFWTGEPLPVDYKIARETRSLISIIMRDPKKGLKLIKDRKVPDDVANKIVDIIKETCICWGHVTLSCRDIVIEEALIGTKKYSIVYAFLGSRGNLALAHLLSRIIKDDLKYPGTVEFLFTPYVVIFKEIGGKLIAEAFEKAKNLDNAEIVSRVYDSLKESIIFLIRFDHVARRMGVIDAKGRVDMRELEKLAKHHGRNIVEVETLKELAMEWLDFKVLIEFLKKAKKPQAVNTSTSKPSFSPLALQVFIGPKVIKQLSLNERIEIIKAFLDSRVATLLCTKCGAVIQVRVSDIGQDGVKCRKCGTLKLAPLPDNERKEQMINIYRKHLKESGKPSGEELKIVKEVDERADIYSNYIYLNCNYVSQGSGHYAVKALIAVSPDVAKNALANLAMNRDEKEFYKEILSHWRKTFRAIIFPTTNKKA